MNENLNQVTLCSYLCNHCTRFKGLVQSQMALDSCGTCRLHVQHLPSPQLSPTFPRTKEQAPAFPSRPAPAVQENYDLLKKLALADRARLFLTRTLRTGNGRDRRSVSSGRRLWLSRGSHGSLGSRGGTIAARGLGSINGIRCFTHNLKIHTVSWLRFATDPH